MALLSCILIFSEIAPSTSDQLSFSSKRSQLLSWARNYRLKGIEPSVYLLIKPASGLNAKTIRSDVFLQSLYVTHGYQPIFRVHQISRCNKGAGHG